MKHNYIKLNNTDNYLSLGNIFRIVKEESNCKNTFLQSELFSAIFDTESIADSTVNNYLTGFRAINSIYKEKLIYKRNKYAKEKNIFYPNILKVVSILENRVISKDYQINSNSKLKNVCKRLYNIAKNDNDTSNEFCENLYNMLNQNKNYEFFIECLLFAVLEKKQPVLVSDVITNSLEKSIYSTNISYNDILDFVNTHLEESMWSVIRKLDILAKSNNALACIQMAFYEFHGLIAGYPRYIKSYNYYKIAADLNHPAANWAIGFMYYNGYIGERSDEDLLKAKSYFEKAISCGSISAINSMGLIYLDGKVNNIKPNKEKAIELFNEAISKGNIFALNNMGKIYENDENYSLAFSYFKKSADLGESWASNKVGEYYRLGIFVKKDMKKAYEYYLKSNENAIYSMSPWAKYNLAKYFYKTGNEELKIDKNMSLAIEMLKMASNHIIEATEELVYIYYSNYVSGGKKDENILNNVKYYIQKIETSPKYNSEIKLRIEKIMKEIYLNKEHINFEE